MAVGYEKGIDEEVDTTYFENLEGEIRRKENR